MDSISHFPSQKVIEGTQLLLSQLQMFSVARCVWNDRNDPLNNGKWEVETIQKNTKGSQTWWYTSVIANIRVAEAEGE